jgi:isopentenyldiphosphate isomerase
MKMELYKPVHVINEDKLIYKVYSVEQLGSEEICYNYNFELIAGHDYINPDESDAQGFVTADKFVEYLQHHNITVFPLTESLGSRLEEDGFTVINIEDYKIHGGDNNE